MKEFIDKTSEQNGTPINRENLMALQGFQSNDIYIEENLVVERNPNQILTTTITENEDGSVTIVEVLEGFKTITKTTTIDAEGTFISEVVS